ncbi:hypothetical protein GCM10027075_11880 [Streptomyces heilongjiangensis]
MSDPPNAGQAVGRSIGETERSQVPPHGARRTRTIRLRNLTLSEGLRVGVGDGGEG